MDLFVERLKVENVCKKQQTSKFRKFAKVSTVSISNSFRLGSGLLHTSPNTAHHKKSHGRRVQKKLLHCFSKGGLVKIVI